MEFIPTNEHRDISLQEGLNQVQLGNTDKLFSDGLETEEKNDMKVFYLAQENFGCVVYADNKNDAFEKMKCQRRELLETLRLPLDITRWGIVEFKPDLYDGVLCFY